VIYVVEKKLKAVKKAKNVGVVENVEKVFLKKDTLLGDALEKYPESAPVFLEYGLHCLGCHVSFSESIEQGCLAHGLSPKLVDELIAKANKKIQEHENAKDVQFDGIAIKELTFRANAAKKKSLMIVESFPGNFDFVPCDNSKGLEEVLTKPKVFANKRIKRMLKGLKLSFNKEINDFEAKKAN
jgi:hybrid cluster-associated redox disulfide protein